MLDDRLGKWTFWLLFVGFNVTFFPQHMLGLMGMVRRIYTYQEHGLFEGYNMTSTIGSYIMSLGILVFADRGREEHATASAPATTRGSRTRSSGTRRRRRRRTTSTRCRT